MSTENLKTIVEDVAEANAYELQRTELPDAVNFVIAASDLKRVIDWASALKASADYEGLPAEKVTALITTLSKATSAFDQMKSWTGSGGTPERDKVAQQLNACWLDLFRSHSDVRAAMFGDGATVDAIRRRAQTVVQDAEKAAIEINAARSDALEAASAAKKAANEAGVAAFSHHFNEAHDEEMASAKPWLFASIGLALLMSLLAVIAASVGYSILFNHKLFGLSINTMFYKSWLIGNGLIFVTAGYGLHIIVRQYRSHIDNAKNKQESALAMRTFEAISQSASPEMKDAVVIGISNLIFSHKPSGFGNEVEMKTQDLATIAGTILKAKSGVKVT